MGDTYFPVDWWTRSPLQNMVRKAYCEHCCGHSSLSSLSSLSCTMLLWGTLARCFCVTLCGILVGHSYVTLLSWDGDTPVKDTQDTFCGTLLCHALVGHSCQTFYCSESSARLFIGHSCETLLRDTHARLLGQASETLLLKKVCYSE